jgi:asparagine synthase (glutamine-hydrolysing)
MSGIAGILHLDGAPVEPARLQRMNDALAGRGPDAQGRWTGKSIGLGHRAFWTTPEAASESQPHQDAAASLAIIFDGRIDNREDLIHSLHSAGCPPRDDTDVEIVLRAYQAWGESCAARLLGDFAFAIWDGPRGTLFCARDLFGARPLYYHYRPGKVFGFASTPAALSAGSVLPRQLNEARIADYLVSELEGIDKTSTFYAEVFRLPPAHTATIGPTGLSLKRYWQPQPGPELRLGTDQEYEAAFLDPFRKAVECRLRGGDTVASMLSGGMDSSSIVGVARKRRLDAGRPPLRTFSVIRRDPAGCPETQAMLEMLRLDNLNPVTLNAEQLADLQPELSQQTWHLEEPYDYHMIVPRSLYILARRQGVRVMLDGIDGDSVLSAGSHLVRLLRHGHAVTAWRDALGQRRVHDGEPSVAAALIHAARSAFAPDWVRRGLRPWRNRQQWQSVLADSLIHPSFAAQTGLRERLETLNHNSRTRHPLDRESDIAGIIDHPYIVCGVERYERVASASGVETRHPFLDRRVVEFCMRLPDSQKFRDGWPKSILRRAMTGYLPETVNWRYGKQHLGEYLTLAYAKRTYPEIKDSIQRGRDSLAQYVRMDEVEKSLDTYESRGDPEVFWRLYETAHLANWLQQQRGE